MTNTLAVLMAACAPLVHPTTLRALIEVESNANPYAVSINRPQGLKKRGINPPFVVQPRSAAAALKLTESLLTRGFGASVGLAQINVEHWARAGIRMADLFNPCINLTVAQRVLLDCNAKQGNLRSERQRLQQTLSCYNTGNYLPGSRNRYPANLRNAARRFRDQNTRSTRSPA